MTDPFIIIQELTFKEFLSSILHHLLSATVVKQFLLCLVALYTLFIILAFSPSSGGTDMAAILDTVVPFFVLLLLVGFLSFLVSVYIFRSKSYCSEFVFYEFTRWGVTRHGMNMPVAKPWERSENAKPWRDILKVEETKAFFLLYYGHTHFYIVKKCMLKDAEELMVFRNLLKKNMSEG